MIYDIWYISMWKFCKIDLPKEMDTSLTFHWAKHLNKNEWSKAQMSCCQTAPDNAVLKPFQILASLSGARSKLNVKNVQERGKSGTHVISIFYMYLNQMVAIGRHCCYHVQIHVMTANMLIALQALHGKGLQHKPCSFARQIRLRNVKRQLVALRRCQVPWHFLLSKTLKNALHTVHTLNALDSTIFESRDISTAECFTVASICIQSK